MKTHNIELQDGKKVYFASDFHLGVPDVESSRERERQVVAWLDYIKKDAQELFLLGDIFDFWFEYKHVVPKGYIRLLGKLAELSDAGIKVHFFIGNHDMWVRDYFSQEFNVILWKEPLDLHINDHKLFVAHGDGLGNGDNKYKFLKACFANPFLQWMFSLLHPDFSFGFANYWSRKSRIVNVKKDEIYYGDKERLVVFSNDVLKHKHYDYFIMGHRHLAMEMQLADNSVYLNTGEWVNLKSFAVHDGQKAALLNFDNNEI